MAIMFEKWLADHAQLAIFWLPASSGDPIFGVDS